MEDADDRNDLKTELSKEYRQNQRKRLLNEYKFERRPQSDNASQHNVGIRSLQLNLDEPRSQHKVGNLQLQPTSLPTTISKIFPFAPIESQSQTVVNVQPVMPFPIPSRILPSERYKQNTLSDTLSSSSPATQRGAMKSSTPSTSLPVTLHTQVSPATQRGQTQSATTTPSTSTSTSKAKSKVKVKPPTPPSSSGSMKVLNPFSERFITVIVDNNNAENKKLNERREYITNTLLLHNNKMTKVKDEIKINRQLLSELQQRKKNAGNDKKDEYDLELIVTESQYSKLLDDQRKLTTEYDNLKKKYEGEYQDIKKKLTKK
jgi:hypothetical protein